MQIGFGSSGYYGAKDQFQVAFSVPASSNIGVAKQNNLLLSADTVQFGANRAGTKNTVLTGRRGGKVPAGNQSPYGPPVDRTTKNNADKKKK